MRVEWDESRCALSGLCTGPAPDVFHAADACPTQAIRVVN